MRNQFLGYYPPTEEELSELWSEGILVLDTNSLLNLYRYSATTTTEYLEVLKGLQESLWLPHQVAAEFHDNRLGLIEEQAKAFNDLIGALNGAVASVEKVASRYQKHEALKALEIGRDVSHSLAPVLERVEKAKAEREAQGPKQPHEDWILDALTDLFEGRVGEGFHGTAREQLCIEGKARYENEVPPGYRDLNKGEPDCYGDLIIWKELLRKAAEEERPAIIVTDDSKEDWWWRVSGKTLGPRVELVAEFMRNTKCRVHLYNAEQFLRYAKEQGSTKVSDDALEEIGQLSELQTVERLRKLAHDRRQELINERMQISHHIRELEFINVVDRPSESQLMLESVAGEKAYLDAELQQLEQQLMECIHVLAETVPGNEVWISSRERIEELSENQSAVLQRREILTGKLEELSRRNQSSADRISAYEPWRRRLQHLDAEIAEVDRALFPLVEGPT